MKLAILDDYQRLALEYADWSSLKGVEVSVFHEPLSSVEQATKQLAPFDIVCLMRERTPFPRALIRIFPTSSSSASRRALAEPDTPALTERASGEQHALGRRRASPPRVTWGLIELRRAAGAGRSTCDGRLHEGLGPGSGGGQALGLLGLGNIGARVAHRQGFAWSASVAQTLTSEKVLLQAQESLQVTSF